MCERLFNDRRVVTAFLGLWTFVCALTFYIIMSVDKSPYLSFGPNDHTRLLGVALDTWTKWWCVAIYTFCSTAIAAFASDSVSPFIMNTIQDHKTVYIPYPKWVCLLIIQVFTCYAIVVTIIGLFVALTQIDFTLIRLVSDLIVNHATTAFFLRGKIVDPLRYEAWMRRGESLDINIDEEFMDIELQIQKDRRDTAEPNENNTLDTTPLATSS